MSTCKDCKFWDEKIVSVQREDVRTRSFKLIKEGTGDGLCRRRCPNYGDKWPNTQAADWCGEFNRKEESS